MLECEKSVTLAPCASGSAPPSFLSRVAPSASTFSESILPYSTRSSSEEKSLVKYCAELSGLVIFVRFDDVTRSNVIGNQLKKYSAMPVAMNMIGRMKQRIFAGSATRRLAFFHAFFLAL